MSELRDIGVPRLAAYGALVAAGSVLIYGASSPDVQAGVAKELGERTELVAERFPILADGARQLGSAACKIYEGVDKELLADVLPSLPVCNETVSIFNSIIGGQQVEDGGIARPFQPVQPLQPGN